MSNKLGASLDSAFCCLVAIREVVPVNANLYLTIRFFTFFWMLWGSINRDPEN